MNGPGVAWGLGVGLAGNAVQVQPGYAIDCCGNDLTVTTPYRVDIPTLLSDPAVCNLLAGAADDGCTQKDRIIGGKQILDAATGVPLRQAVPRGRRMHLLLEYVECPEEPRPVHGDPCSGNTTACEMSRVRETVRLRLVPPRDYQPGGPIQAFLDAIGNNKQIVGSNVVAKETSHATNSSSSSSSGSASAVAAQPSGNAPIEVLTIPATPESVRQPFPCLTEPCCPGGSKPLFDVFPPFAHEYPPGSGTAAAPRVWLEALAFVLRLSRTLAGDSLSKQSTASRTPIEQLFADLCCGLLYRGPECAGNPHGVVIGCAVVQAGTITHVDPWGGRRWAVHYPLVSHWLEQFGLLPPDVIASKFFSIVCCLSGLAARLEASRTPNNDTSGTVTSTLLKSLGSGHLLLGKPDDLSPEEKKQLGPETLRSGRKPWDWWISPPGPSPRPASPRRRRLSTSRTSSTPSRNCTSCARDVRYHQDDVDPARPAGATRGRRGGLAHLHGARGIRSPRGHPTRVGAAGRTAAGRPRVPPGDDPAAAPPVRP